MLRIDRLSIRLPAEGTETPEAMARRIGHELLSLAAYATKEAPAEHLRVTVRVAPGGDIAAQVASAVRSKLGGEPS